MKFDQKVLVVSCSSSFYMPFPGKELPCISIEFVILDFENSFGLVCFRTINHFLIGLSCFFHLFDERLVLIIFRNEMLTLCLLTDPCLTTGRVLECVVSIS